jgi:GTP cyclohydrolase I
MARETVVAPPVPKGWGVCRVTAARKWNGKCVLCGEKSEAGQSVAWDPHSGRPSKWRHVSCRHPWADAELFMASQAQKDLFTDTPAPAPTPALVKAATSAARNYVLPSGTQAEEAVRTILLAIGEDPTREGLADTPRRVVAMLTEMCRREPFKFTAFKSEGMDELIVQSPIGFSSLCEHHMLPFVGTAAVAYIPKLARAVKCCASGLQNQERITTAIADMLEKELAPQGIGVVLRARHMCMEVRGVRTEGAFTTTSCMRGALRADGKARGEFLRLAGMTG